MALTFKWPFEGTAVQVPRACQLCGSENLLLKQSGNDIYVPTFNGNFLDLRQASDGTISIRRTTLVKACPSTNPCPLFSAPASITDLVFFGGGEGNIYAADLQGPWCGRSAHRAWWLPVRRSPTAGSISGPTTGTCTAFQ